MFFLREGTCTIAASQRPRGVAEAQQSFMVSAWPKTLTLPTSSGMAETNAKTAPTSSNKTAATPKRTLAAATKLEEGPEGLREEQEQEKAKTLSGERSPRARQGEDTDPARRPCTSASRRSL